jgi:hypothetical protein
MDEPLLGEAGLRRELEELRRENARLLSLLRISGVEVRHTVATPEEGTLDGSAAGTAWS